MNKSKFVCIRISEEQEKILEARMFASGFMTRSEYIRYFIFTTMTVEGKISKIYEKVVGNG